MMEVRPTPVLLAAILESAAHPTVTELASALPVGNELRSAFMVITQHPGGEIAAHGAPTISDAVRLLFALQEPGMRLLYRLKVADVEDAREEVDRYLAAPRRRYGQ